MKYLHRLVAVASAAIFIASAHAQNAGTVTNHAFVLGKGAGTTGYTSLLCGSAQLAVGQSAADPICKTITGDVTLSAAGAVTLATVNSNVGSFGSATNCTAITVNAKGLITAASATTCTPAIGSVTGLGTGVATWLATPSSANLRAALTDETGTGLAYFQGGALGTPSSATLTNATGLPPAGLTTQGAYTFLGNNTGSAASPTAVDMAALTTKASPGVGDYVMLSDQAASGAWKKATVASLGGGGSGVSSLNTETGAMVQWPSPQGRLTLTSNTPVMATSVTAATTVYYTSTAAGKSVPIYNGSAVVVRQLCAAGTAGACELSAALGSNWAASSNYDWFVGLDSGTLRLCSGPDWSAGAVAGSNTVGASTRGTGAGSTDLENLDGLLTNKNSMTCRYNNTTTFTCAVHQCTYVGSSRTGSAGQVSFTYGSQGTAGTFYLWNAYNQAQICSASSDSTASWVYGVATPRQANNSSVNQFNFMSGLASGSVDASQTILARPASASGALAYVGIALNSTSTVDKQVQLINPTVSLFNASINANITYGGRLGANFIAAIEYGDGVNGTTYFAQNFMTLRACMGM
ncbi:hypothetical protein [Bradyrhizobium sp. LA2.1]|uniref:hypothetical protein n=1 Tax=Bradyrhizobium sp. LA2.1 TaxID=3156376 RepID=UPI003390C56D